MKKFNNGLRWTCTLVGLIIGGLSIYIMMQGDVQKISPVKNQKAPIATGTTDTASIKS